MDTNHDPQGATLDRLLTQREAATLLGLKNENTLNAWRVRRQGPAFVRVGTAVRYRLADLNAWIEARTVRPPAA